MLLPTTLRRAGRAVRTGWRLAQTGALIGGGLLTLYLAFPLCRPGWRQRIKQAWSARLLRALGVRVLADGKALEHGALIASNHISWLDVFVINALAPTTFVCKDEVRAWPVIGRLVSRSGTLFIERGRAVAAARTTAAITARLSAGERVAIFPEGTTSCGTALLPFRAALFEAAVAGAAQIQPLALRYLDTAGRPSQTPTYIGDTSFGQSLLAIARSDGVVARLGQLTPELHDGRDRRALAQATEERIRSALAAA